MTPEKVMLHFCTHSEPHLYLNSCLASPKQKMVMPPKLAWDVGWILSGERNGNEIGTTLNFVLRNASRQNEHRQEADSLHSL